MDNNMQDSNLLEDLKNEFQSLTSLKVMVQNNDSSIISFLLSRSKYKEEYRIRFFEKVIIEGNQRSYIFKKEDFLQFLDIHFLAGSYTSFANKIGLGFHSKKFLKSDERVVLNFPFKDGVIKGGQSRDEDKSNELFFNNILAKNEIDTLLSPKALTGFKILGETWGVKDYLVNKPNLLIKGNNLIALHSLKSYFKDRPQSEKVKLIYIDPPYNTGNDSFNYNDRFNHSTWLTFMKNRLEVARELLRDDGVIFVQCDDNEQAYLKVLMDEIFGRDNFVACFVWQRTKTPARLAKLYSKTHEYILVYSKLYDNLIFNRVALKDDYIRKTYKNLDNDPRGLWRLAPLLGTQNSPNKIATYTLPDGRQVTGKWRCSEETLKQYIKDNIYYCSENGSPNKKIFLKDNIGQVIDSLLLNEGTNENATEELKSLFGFNNQFSYPKPETLINKIIEISTSENDLVLDFFAGSGTTLAVAHKMNRRYIGIEQMDYIEDITLARMKKVIEGEEGGISKAVNWQGGGSLIYAELASLNEAFIKQIENAESDEELNIIYERLRKEAFLDYRADIKDLLQDKDYKSLSIDEKRAILFNSLDRNMDYIPYEDISDEIYSISAEDKELNNIFYKGK